MTEDESVQLAVNAIRALSIDAVQAAKSGHPGTPMALAPLVYTIRNRVMHFDPQDSFEIPESFGVLPQRVASVYTSCQSRNLARNASHSRDPRFFLYPQRCTFPIESAPCPI